VPQAGETARLDKSMRRIDGKEAGAMELVV
jgi:hypothetical protein